MPPSPNTSASGEVESIHENEERLSVQQAIKDLFSQQGSEIVTLKPYDDTLKEWETFSGKTCDSSNVTEKIKKFEERIQTLIKEDKNLSISRTCRKENTGAVINSSLKECQNETSPESEILETPVHAEKIEFSGVTNGKISNNTNGKISNGTNGKISNGTNGTINYNGNTKLGPKLAKIGFKISFILFVYIHLTGIYGLYLYSSGQVISDNTIYFAFLCHIVSIGVHLGLRKRITTESKPMLFFMSLLQPTISKDSHFEWARKKSSLLGNKPILQKISLLTGILIAIIPLVLVLTPWMLWDEPLLTSYLFVGQLQYCFSLYICLLIG